MEDLVPITESARLQISTLLGTHCSVSLRNKSKVKRRKRGVFIFALTLSFLPAHHRIHPVKHSGLFHTFGVVLRLACVFLCFEVQVLCGLKRSPMSLRVFPYRMRVCKVMRVLFGLAGFLIVPISFVDFSYSHRLLLSVAMSQKSNVLSFLLLIFDSPTFDLCDFGPYPKSVFPLAVVLALVCNPCGPVRIVPEAPYSIAASCSSFAAAFFTPRSGKLGGGGVTGTGGTDMLGAPIARSFQS
jgi:hypothetical protein